MLEDRADHYGAGETGRNFIPPSFLEHHGAGKTGSSSIVPSFYEPLRGATVASAARALGRSGAWTLGRLDARRSVRGARCVVCTVHGASCAVGPSLGVRPCFVHRVSPRFTVFHRVFFGPDPAAVASGLRSAGCGFAFKERFGGVRDMHFRPLFCTFRPLVG